MSSPRPDTDYDSLAKKAWGVTTPSKVGGYKPRTKTSGNPDFDNLYDEKGRQYDIDPDLLIAQGRQESGFRPNAKSPAGARGISQFMPGTAKELDVNPNDVGSSIDGQARLMRSLIDRTNDVDLALAGYNSGHNASINRLKRNKERIPETRNYVAKIGQEYRTPTAKPTSSLDDIAKKAWAASPYDDIAKQAWGAVDPTATPTTPDIPHEAPHIPTELKDREALQPVDTTAIDAMMRAPQRGQQPIVKVPTQAVQRPTKGKPTQQTAQEQPVINEEVTVIPDDFTERVEYRDVPKGADKKEFAIQQLIPRIANRIKADTIDVEKALRELGGDYDAKDGINFKMTPGFLERVDKFRNNRVDVAERAKKSEADFNERVKAIDPTLDAPDRDLEAFRLKGMADIDAGLITPEQQTEAYEKLKKDVDAWKEDRGFLGIWNQKEWADIQRFMGGRPDTGNQRVSESYQPSGLGKEVSSPKEYFDKAYADMQKQYGNATNWVRIQKEHKARFKDAPFLAMMKGGEAVVGGAMKAPFQGAASALKSIAIGSEAIDKAIGGDQREAKDRYSYKLAESINDIAEGIKVDEYYKGGNAELAGQIMGQVLTQTGLGLLTGGAAAPAAFGAGQGMATGYDEGTAEGLDGWTRLGKSLVAGLIEAPDYFVFKGMFKGGNALNKITAVQNLKATLEKGLIARGIVAPVAEKMAVAAADGFATELAAKGGLKGIIGKGLKASADTLKTGGLEAIQEGTTRPLNDLWAFISYDRSPERWEKATTLTGRDFVEGVGGFFGGIIGASAANMIARTQGLDVEGVEQAQALLEQQKELFPEQTYNDAKIALENRKAYFAKDAQIQQEKPKTSADKPLVPTDLRGVSVNEKGETTYAGETKAEIEERRRFERATPNITAQQVSNLAEDKGIDIATVTDKPLAEMSADELRNVTRAIEAATAPRKVDPKRKSVFDEVFGEEAEVPVEKPKKKIKPKTEVTEVEQPVEIPVDKPTITKGTTVYKGKLGGEVLRVKDGKANVQIYLPDGSLGDQVEYDVDELSTVAPTTVDAVSTEKPSGKVKNIVKDDLIPDRPTLVQDDMEGMGEDATRTITNKQGVTYKKTKEGDIFAFIKGKEVGFATALAEDAQQGYDISVAQEHQRKGIGSELFRLYNQIHPNAPTGGLTKQGQALVANVSPKAKSTTPKVGDKVENIIGGWKGTIAEVDGDLVVKRGEKVWGDYNPVNYTSVDEPMMMAVGSKQTDTPEFKKYFGKSKVVDEKGEPLVVYHGTKGDFDTFNTEFSADKQKAFYFTRDPRYAAMRAGTQGMARGSYFWENEVIQKPGVNVMPVFLSIQNPRTIQFSPRDKFSSPEIERSRIFDIKSSNKYDGAIFEKLNANGDVIDRYYVAFSPTQIKSAIGNKGTFDPNDPNILHKRPVEGSPEFNKATELANLPKRGETFLKGVESTAKEGFIDLSPEAVELGRVIDKAVGRSEGIRYGTTYTKAEAIDHIEGAKDLRQVLKDKGMSTKAIDKYITDFEKVAKENQGIVPVGIEEAKKHETLHGADAKSKILLLTDDEGNITEKTLVTDEEAKKINALPLFKTFKQEYAKFVGRSVESISDTEAMAEAISYLGDGEGKRFGLSPQQSASVLADIGIARFNSLVEAYDGDVEKAKANMAAFNIEGGEKIYEAIKSTDNGKGVRPSTESGQKREGKSETVGSQDVGNAETAGQGKTDTEESDGVKLKSRTPGKSGLTSNPEKVAEAKAEGKKVAAISKMLGIEDYYTPQGHEETEANVNEILGEMTFDQAVTQAMHATPSPEASRVLAREAQRLVGIAESYRQQGKPAEFMATLQRAGEIVGALKIRQIQTGREVEIQKMLEPLTPEAAVVTAEYLYQMTFDKPMSHAQRDEVFNLAKENQRLQGELATAEMKLAEQDRIIAEIDNNVPEKKPFNHQEALLRNYQKRKPVLLAELKKRFPNSSAFQGDVMLMAVGKDTSDKTDIVIDPKTAKLLEEYAIGQILTDRSYEAVIRELQEISGASEAQVKDIHARAANEVRGAKEPQTEEAKKRIQIRKEHYTEAEKHAHPEKIVERALKAAESALTRQIKILEEEIESKEKAEKEKKTLISDKLTELRAKRDKLKTEHDALFNPPKVKLVKVPMTQAQKVDRAKAARLRKEIAEVNKEIEAQERRAKEIKPIYLPSVETQQLQKQLADAKAKRDAIFEAKGIPQQERIAKAEKAAREALQTLRKKVTDHDLAVVRGKPVKSGALTAIRAEQKELRKALNDLRKANTQTVTGLSRYGQKSLDKNPEDIELAIAVDLLSNKQPHSIDSVILKLQNDYGFTPPEAKEIAQQAKQTIKDLKAEDARARDKAKGISDEQREIINAKRQEQLEAANRLNRFLSNVANNPTLIKRFNDDFRIKLVANWGTQIFNAVQVATVATPAQLSLDILEIGLQTLGVKIGEQTEIRARDLLLPYYYMFSANRQIAEQALANFPELYFDVHKGLLGDIPIEPLQLADTKNGLSKVAHKWFDINAKYNEFATKWSGAKMFEMHFRNSVIAASFDQTIKKKTKGEKDLQSVMKEGKLREYITEENAKRAAKRAMDVTFASEIDDPVGIQLKRAYDAIDPYLPVLLNPVTYARFMYSTSKQAVINPIFFGALDSKKLGGEGYSTRSIAKGLLAWSTLYAAGALLSAIGGDDDKWYTIYPLGKDGPVFDIRRSYPLAAYFYIAHNIKQGAEGKPLDRDVLGGLLSLETEYFQHGAPMEFLGAGWDVLSQKKGVDHLGKAGARVLGGYLSGIARVAKPMRDLWAQFDADERAYREDPESAKDKFLNEVSRSIPGVIRLSDQKKQTDIDGKVLEQQFPIGRIFGVNVVHPEFIREAGSKAEQWARRLWEKDFKKMSPEEKRAYTLRNQIKKAVRAGKMDAEAASKRIDSYVKEGRLSEALATRLKNEMVMSPLEFKVKMEFSADKPDDVENLKQVLSVATPEEKEALTKVLLKKSMPSELRKELGLNKVPSTGVDAMLNAPEMKKATTDDLVEIMKLEGYTAEEKAKVTQALLQKAGNALKSKTLTAEEIENIKTVLPDFSETGAQKAISSAKIASSNLSDDIKSTFDSLGISAPSVGDSLTPKKGGEKIKLTPEQQAKYERETIERIEAKVRSLQTTTAYKNAPENVRKKMIEGIIRKQRSEEQKETKSEMLKAPKLADLAYAKDGGSDFEPRPIEYPDSPDKWKGQRLSTNIIDKRKGSKLDMFANLITGDIGEIRKAKFDGRGVERAEAKRLLNEQIAEARYGIKKGATNAKQVLGELLKLRARF